MIEAVHYESVNDKLRLTLYPDAPLLADGEEDAILGYKNEGGKLYATNYGKLITASYEPMEKKPFFHFYPNSTILSIAHRGSNVRGPLTDNLELSASSRTPKEIDIQISPRVVGRAKTK